MDIEDLRNEKFNEALLREIDNAVDCLVILAGTAYSLASTETMQSSNRMGMLLNEVLSYSP
jgi:hypothetical protein